MKIDAAIEAYGTDLGSFEEIVEGLKGVASKNVFKKELIIAGYNPNSEIRSKKIVSLFF